MVLSQATPYIVTETVDWWVEILKSLIVAAPVILVTWFIWYLSGVRERRRERIKTAFDLSAMCRKYTLLHHEHEKNKIDFQGKFIYANKCNKEEKDIALRLLENARHESDKLKILRLEVTTEITKLNGQLIIYTTKSQANGLNDMINEASELSSVGDFKDKFSDVITPEQAMIRSKELITDIDKKLFKEGYSKKYEEIRSYLFKEFVNKKPHKFTYYLCHFCCCCDC